MGDFDPLYDRELGTHHRCAWSACWQPSSDRYPLTLCDQHALYIWATVRNSIEPHDATERPKRQPADPDGLVYYIAIGNLVKIGFTTDLDQRLTAYGPAAVFLACEPGDLAVERSRHEQFAYCRVAGREWYERHPILEQHIEKLAFTPLEWGDSTNKGYAFRGNADNKRILR